VRAGVTIIAGIGAIAVLAGCQEQKTIVLEQASAGSVAAAGVPAAAPRPPPTHGSPCAAPAGTGPFEHVPPPLSSDKVQMPSRAVAEHVRGCTGIRFRIGSDGLPQDISILAAYPYGYGFGESGQRIVASAKWTPRDDLAWHYLVINMDPDSHR
jgi:hypothetical protein